VGCGVPPHLDTLKNTAVIARTRRAYCATPMDIHTLCAVATLAAEHICRGTRLLVAQKVKERSVWGDGP
jgi:hypothetical protein